MKLSEHFDRTEFEKDGCVMPDEGVVQSYLALCQFLLEPIRAKFPEPFFIDSGYRDAASNARVGGVKDSQHVATDKFCACDFYLESYRASMQPVFDWICRDSNLMFDQVILEHGKNGDIIHISYSSTPRRMALEGATFNKSPYTAKFVAPLQMKPGTVMEGTGA